MKWILLIVIASGMFIYEILDRYFEYKEKTIDRRKDNDN